MALYLKDPDVDKLAREVATMEGISITEAVGNALLDRRAKLLAAREDKLRKVDARLVRLRAMPVLDPRSLDEILYDENGQPR
jgi:antitoxin VapB